MYYTRILAAMQSAYRQAIRTQGMVEDLVRHLSNDNEELKMHCASAIFKVQHTLSFFD